MQRVKLLLTGFGFFWIFLWSVVGSFLGVKLNLAAAQGGHLPQAAAWQKKMLTLAHAHMNMMGITLILMALTIGLIRHVASDTSLKAICFVNLVSVIVFGGGLLSEAFYPTQLGSVSPFVTITGLGACAYMITVAIWSCLFIFGSFKK